MFLSSHSYRTSITLLLGYSFVPMCEIDGNRSGLACKNHIDCGAGVIDADYRGDIGVILFNHGKEPLEVKLHDRVAQLILERHMVGEELKEVDDLDVTERGASGYGSTGFGSEIKR
jgi:deoxyuridine 5'-triphosphate nucleotidohydrolase